MLTTIKDRFAGLSSLSDGDDRPPTVAGVGEQLLIGELNISSTGGLRPCRSTSASGYAGSLSGSVRSSSIA
jgi:hypothetical protein